MYHVLSIKASHARGMGHLYRGLNLAGGLKAEGDGVSFVINNDERSMGILKDEGYSFDIVDYGVTGWEGAIIERRKPATWINDRLDTVDAHAKEVLKKGVALFTFDDHGSGASLAKKNFLAMDLAPVERFPNGLYGPEYMILNPAISAHRKKTREFKGALKVLVTLGGSDTYGVTPRAVSALKGVSEIEVEIVVGPNFAHSDELTEAASSLGGGARIHRTVPDLIACMSAADLLICGGGVTLFETAALGVPACAIANESHEVSIIGWFERNGFAKDLGFHAGPFEARLKSAVEGLVSDRSRLSRMSEAGKALVDCDGLKRVLKELRSA